VSILSAIPHTELQHRSFWSDSWSVSSFPAGIQKLLMSSVQGIPLPQVMSQAATRHSGPRVRVRSNRLRMPLRKQHKSD
jgi:hypothetical protein